MIAYSQQLDVAGVPASPIVAGAGLRCEMTRIGSRVTGQIALDYPNPSGRVRCRLGYNVPASWTPAHHEAALRVAAHWFRDIGGFNTIEKSELCHIVQVLQRGRGEITEQQLHAAVAAYAASKWHREGRRWKTIQCWFTSGDWKAWLDKAPDPEQVADQAQRRAAAEAEYQRKLEADRAAHRAAHRAQLSAKIRSGDVRAPLSRRPVR